MTVVLYKIDLVNTNTDDVYGEAGPEEIRYKALCNIGYRPTFSNDKKLSIETYILNKNYFDLYGKYVTIEFLSYIRNEMKFFNEKELRKQIKNDIKEIHSN